MATARTFTITLAGQKYSGEYGVTGDQVYVGSVYGSKTMPVVAGAQNVEALARVILSEIVHEWSARPRR